VTEIRVLEIKKMTCLRMYSPKEEFLFRKTYFARCIERYFEIICWVKDISTISRLFRNNLHWALNETNYQVLRDCPSSVNVAA
jgi:hypothetical protein